jgi:hypothetical protein
MCFLSAVVEGRVEIKFTQEQRAVVEVVELRF